MAKETDLNKLHTEIVTQLSQVEWYLLEYIDIEKAAIVVQNIYLTNDLMTGFGQDLLDELSIISSKHRISIIYKKYSSYYKTRLSICDYEALEVDITSILMMIESAFIRMQDSM